MKKLSYSIKILASLAIISATVFLTGCDDDKKRQTKDASVIPTATLSVTDEFGSESGDTAQFRVRLSRAASEDLRVFYSVNASSSHAIPGADYEALPGSVTVLKGQSAATITVKPIADNIPEGDEPVAIYLTAGAGYSVTTSGVANAETELVIIRDGSALTASVDAIDDEATEPAHSDRTDNGTLKVSLNKAASTDLNILFEIGGTAILGVDYTAQFADGTNIARENGYLTIPAGQTSANITIIPLDDSLSEGTESVAMRLVNGSGYATAAGLSDDAVEIYDDGKTPTVSITATDSVILEKDCKLDDTIDETVASFTISLSDPACEDLVIYYSVDGSTAVAGGDYALLPGHVMIKKGESSAEVTVQALDDDLYEGVEYIDITLVASGNYTLLFDTSARIFVQSDEQLPSASITAVDALASETGSDNGMFRVQIDMPVKDDLWIRYGISGSADNGNDYTFYSEGLDNHVVLPAGETSVDISIVANDDSLVEALESAQFTLEKGARYALQPGLESATVYILSDEAAPTVGIYALDSEASEDGDTASLCVFVDSAQSTPLNVDFRAAGSATAGVDYLALGAITIPANQTQVILTITAVDDMDEEGTEDVEIELLRAPMYAISGPSTATAYIADNEVLPVASLEILDNLATEDGDLGRFRVCLDQVASEDTFINVSRTGSAAEGTDYTTLGTVRIPEGAKTVTFTIAPISDDIIEGPETVELELNSGLYSVDMNMNRGTIYIQDRNRPNAGPVAHIVAVDDMASEDGDVGVFKVFIDSLYDSDPDPVITTYADLTVNLTIGGGASAGTDYVTIDPTVIIPAGETEAIITVYANTFSDGRGAPEDVEITLAAGAGYEISPDLDSAQVWILDISPADPVLGVFATQPFAYEAGLQPGTFTFYLSRPASQDIVVNYTSSGDAIESLDYQALPSVVVIPAGSTSATVDVTPIDDSIPEPNETVEVTAFEYDNCGYIIENDSDVVDIVSDDAPLAWIVATDAIASEVGNDTATFTVYLETPATANTVVQYSVWGSAEEGVDYQALPSSVTIPAGSSMATITVTAIDDTEFDNNEQVIVELDAVENGYAVGSTATSRATVTIISDEAFSTATVVASDSIATEGADQGEFTVILDQPFFKDVTVEYEIVPIAKSATEDVDYEPIARSVVIPAGETRVVIPVIPIDDEDIEALGIGNSAEVVFLRLVDNNPNEYELGEPEESEASVWIVDNDKLEDLEITFDTIDSVATEDGGTGTFLISLNMTVSESLTISYVVGGSADPVDDYAALSGTVAIPAGQTTATINIVPVDDNEEENDETVVVTLTQVIAELENDPTDIDYNFSAPATGTVTILENDIPVLPTATITATDSMASEDGDAASFTISLDRSAVGDLTVLYTVTGTATANNDYRTLSGLVVIAAGSTSATVPVIAVDDDVIEAAFESVVVDLVAGPLGYNLSTFPAEQGAVAWIADNDETGSTIDVAISKVDPIATEGSSDNASVVIYLSEPAPEDVTVVYTVNDVREIIAPQNPTDPSVANWNEFYVDIPQGQRQVLLSIVANNDADEEFEENVTFTIVDAVAPSPSHYVYNFGAPNSTFITVISDEVPPTTPAPIISVVTTTANVDEDEAAQLPPVPGRFTVRSNVPVIGNVWVNYSISGSAVNGNDYNFLNGTVQILAGNSEADIDVMPINDFTFEGDETVTVVLETSGAYELASNNITAQLTIVEDDVLQQTPRVTVARTLDAIASDSGVLPDETHGVFTISSNIDAPPGGITVSFTLMGDAVEGVHYQSGVGSVTINAPLREVIVTIDPASRAIIGATNKDVIMVLDADASYEIGSPGAATLTIRR